jgi:Fe-S cluster assembly ATP-binding protein|tara:strand:+ start:198 stop:911 length:714 start_codon:yes stop_codon:yes gene_type:complete
MLVTQEFTVKVDNQVILSDLHLDFGPGIHIIMGPNGVGKSTFAHGLMGNPNYDVSGAAQLNGKDLLDMETFERSRAGLFVSFQNPTPVEGLSNFQFVRQTMMSKDENVSTIKKLTDFKGHAEVLGLPEDWDKKQLNVEASGGQKKKNELIQMLMLDPQVVILDEPDSGLDIDAIKDLIQTIKEFASRNKTIIIISHYERLINELDIESVVVLGKNKTKKGDVSLAHKVLQEGFKDFE